ncbi:hypothetical protein C8A00DRAFT_37893, partial [Chaetomidium leptoderma]
MNSLRPLPLLSSRFILSSNGARTAAIGVRHASTEAATAATAAAAAAAPAPPTVPVPAARDRAVVAKKGNPAKERANRRATPPPNHGERLWVYNHMVANFTVYSTTPEME